MDVTIPGSTATFASKSGCFGWPSFSPLRKSRTTARSSRWHIPASSGGTTIRSSATSMPGRIGPTSDGPDGVSTPPSPPPPDGAAVTPAQPRAASSAVIVARALGVTLKLADACRGRHRRGQVGGGVQREGIRRRQHARRRRRLAAGAADEGIAGADVPVAGPRAVQVDDRVLNALEVVPLDPDHGAHAAVHARAVGGVQVVVVEHVRLAEADAGQARADGMNVVVMVGGADDGVADLLVAGTDQADLVVVVDVAAGDGDERRA